MLDGIEKLTGGRPPSCPWRAFREPIVSEVLTLYRACGGATEAGPVPSRVLALDPTYAAWQGLLHYVQAIALTRASDAKKARDSRAQSGRAQSAAASMRRRHG